MAKTSRRKLFLFGKYSLALLPPKKWLSELGIKEGDEVVVELDRARSRLIVRLKPGAAGSGDQKKPSPNTPPDDWQPIPQL